MFFLLSSYIQSCAKFFFNVRTDHLPKKFFFLFSTLCCHLACSRLHHFIALVELDLFSNIRHNNYLVKQYLGYFFNIFIVFKSQRMGKEWEKTPVCLKLRKFKLDFCTKMDFFKGRFAKMSCSKTAVNQAIAGF